MPRLLRILIAAALALASAPLARAQPPDHPPYRTPSMHLAWDDCYSEGTGGPSDKSFACDANTGDTFKLFASVRPPAGITRYVGNLCVFDLQSASPALPQWWQIGGCRLATSLIAAPSSGQTTCPDLSSQPHFGGIDYNFSSTPNRARLRTAYALDAGLTHALDPLLEQTVLAITLNRSRTIGTAHCPGCTTPVCIVWTSILLDQAPGPPVMLTTTGERYWATWQGPSQGVPCPAATPTQGRTWGQLKSLYR